MSDEELLLWLRVEDTNLTDFAADRIEQLVATNEELLAERNDWESHAIYNAEFVDLAVSYRNERDAARAKLAECEARLGKAVELLEAWGDVAVHCSIEEGVCCCGDNMENHTNPMDCGHTPLDHGTYIAIQLAEETRATLAAVSETHKIKGETHDPL